MIITNHLPAKSLNTVFEELFNTFPATGFKDNKASFATPAVNITETEQGYQLELLAPGRNKEDFQISVDKGLLTISDEVKQKEEKNENKAIRKEFALRSFKRSFTLDNEKTNADAIEARYENGILQVLIPKKEEVKISPKRIDIQ